MLSNLVSRSVGLSLIGIVSLLTPSVGSSQTAQQPKLVLHAPPSAVTVHRKLLHAAPPAQMVHPGTADVLSGDRSLGVQSQPDQALTVYSIGDPTGEEQQVLEMINRARANPTAEGVLLSGTTDADVTQAYTYWGTPTRSQIKSEFATYSPQPPLSFNGSLITAARGHSQDMLDHDFQGHNGSDGSTFTDRIQRAGYTGFGNAGENVFAYGTSTFDIHASFNIDFGNYPGLGHRTNIMNMAGFVYKEVGIGIIHGSNGTVGPLLTTEDFGDRGQAFITGVVWNDLNHNGFYDPGEGLSGVTIKLSSGQYSAISSSSGGYSIPFSGSGSVTVTASGGALGATVSHSVDFNGDNVKVDFQPDKTGLPAQVFLVLPLQDTTISSDTTRFTWNKLTGVTFYRIQVATDSLMKKLVLSDSTITDTSKVLRGLKDTVVYFWRVQARNAKGWGDYTPVQRFTVFLPPQILGTVFPKNKSVVGDTDIMFVWNSGTRAFDYFFELASDPQFTHHVRSDTVSDTTAIVFASELPTGFTYYWRVSAENESGWSRPSIVQSITKGTSSVNSDPQADHSLASRSVVAPNPAQSDATISFTIEKAEPVTLKIVNASGCIVETLDYGILLAGDRSVTWNATKLPAGAYYYQLQLGNRTDTGNIIVTK